VTIRASDRGASEQFYDTVLATIGLGRWTRFTASPSRPATATTARQASARIYHARYHGAFVLDPDS
jgi:hypothetical protein